MYVLELLRDLNREREEKRRLKQENERLRRQLDALTQPATDNPWELFPWGRA